MSPPAFQKYMDRRSFISVLGISSGGLALACSGLSRRAETFAATGDFSSLRSNGFGELISTASKNTGETFLALPRGFEYNVIGKFDSPLADGRVTPRLHDGMAAFKVKNELRIVRNHEVVGGKIPRPGSAIAKDNHYDETAGGGTTTLVIDPKTRQIVRDFVSLSGTLINCCGGPTPWGSWVSCEETVVGQTVTTDSRGNKIGGFPKPHGYCFEVPASANTNLPPVPLKAMGRFVHAAIADRSRAINVVADSSAGRASAAHSSSSAARKVRSAKDEVRSKAKVLRQLLRTSTFALRTFVCPCLAKVLD